MVLLISVLKVVTSFVILNVWLLRKDKVTVFRGGTARNLNEEISYYGLPEWSFKAIGASKISLALLMIASLWLPQLALISSLALGLFMLGAVLMHFKVNDPIVKYMPSLLLLSSCVIVFLFSA